MKVVSQLQCAHSCLHYNTQYGAGKCNAFSYTGQTCELAKLSFLEDPAPGKDEKSIMVEVGSHSC